MKKRCVGECGKLLPVSSFYKTKRNKTGTEGTCKKCRGKRGGRWAKKNRDKVNVIQRRYWRNGGKIKKMAHAKRYVEENRIKVNALHRRIRRRMIDAVIDGYGGPLCVCCGEEERLFLTIDHINGGGRQERIKHGSGDKLYAFLKRNNFPKGYQVMCFNCNCGRARNGGVCPHKRKS